MLTLAFDTATDAASCALVRDRDVLGERPSRAGRILHDIDEVLAGAGVEPAELDGIVVGTGPGSYTGLRMGLVTARTLAFSLGIPVAGVSTLDALAAGSPGEPPCPRCAPRGGLYPRWPGSTDASVRMISSSRRARPRWATVRCATRPPPGFRCARAAGREPRTCALGASPRLLASNFGPPEAAEPIYLRAPDAERKPPGMTVTSLRLVSAGETVFPPCEPPSYSRTWRNLPGFPTPPPHVHRPRVGL